MPERANSCRHIGDEKMPKTQITASNCVSLRCISSRSPTRNCVFIKPRFAALVRASSSRFAARSMPKTNPCGSNYLGRGQSRRSATAAHVKHTCAQRELETLDCRTTEPFPKGISRIIVIVSRGIVGSRSFGFRVIWSCHGVPPNETEDQRSTSGERDRALLGSQLSVAP